MHYGRLARFDDPTGKTLHCVVCGKTFTRSAGRSKTCSADCSTALKKRNKRRFDSAAPSLKTTKNCSECGNTFVATTNQITCSPECRSKRRTDYEESRKAQRRRPKLEVSCAWCNKMFIPATHAKTCSPECRKKYERAKKAARGKGLISKNCVVCGDVFKTGGVSNRVTTCSAECRSKRATERLRARQPGQNEQRRGEKNRQSNLFRRFGITEADYLRMLDDQGGQCAICGTSTPGTSGVFAVDHDHETGKVRGLLCRSCNVGIGNLGDDPGRLAAAIRYLLAHS
jgi:predicted nucleic acid-binding Zn ribbon protein